MTSTPNKNLAQPANNSDIGFWDQPVNTNSALIDTAFGGLTSINAAGASGTVNLSQTQVTPPTIRITGALAGNVLYTIPANVGGLWYIDNRTTGGFTTTFSSLTGGGTTVACSQGATTPILCDGTNVQLQSTVGAAAGGSNTQVQINSSGALAGVANLTYNGTTFTIGGAVALSVGGNLILGGNVNSSLNVAGNAQTVPRVVAFSATAMAVNCNLSNVFATVLTGSVTVAPAINNPNDGQTINWFLIQDASGSRTMSWPAAFKWPGGVKGVLSTTANAVDLLVATYRASSGNWYAGLGKDYR